MELPLSYVNRMKEYLGDECEAFIASYDDPEIKGLRLNTLAPRESLGAICNEFKNTLCGNDIPWMKDGFYYESERDGDVADEKTDRLRPGKHPYHEAGAYYIQEPAAMLPAIYLNVKPGDRVLDLCAAPGGKSTQIAAMLNGEGILVSNEIMPDRAKILSENIERMGVRNALVISEDPRNISDKFAGFFDKVLVDAPCSGEGMFRRSDIAINEWSLDNVKLCADRQAWILDEAAKMLASGGTLVYSTCTFSKEEDEEQIVSFLKRHDEFILAEMELYDGLVRGQSESVQDVGVRLFPHRVKGEGHYICKLLKSGYNDSENQDHNRTDIELTKISPLYGYEPDISKKDKSDLKDMFLLFEELFEGSFIKYMEERRITRFKDQVYLLPKDCPSLKGVKVIRPGLHLGTIQKNRFEPGHALAMSLRPSEVKKRCNILSEGQEIYKYFRGETFNIEENMIYSQDVENAKGKNKDKLSGYYVIFVDGLSTGWGKLTNYIMKNHYPKGLRKNLT